MEDSSVQAQILCHELGIFDWRKQFEISEQVTFIARCTGESMEQTREKMIAAWRNYRAQRGKLTWVYESPAKFFAWDAFNDQDAWPWKEQRFEPGITNQSQPALSGQELEEARRACARINARRAAQGLPLIVVP